MKNVLELNGISAVEASRQSSAKEDQDISFYWNGNNHDILGFEVDTSYPLSLKE